MRTDIVAELEALSEHYPKPRRDAAAQARFLADYVTDLNRFTPAEVKTACAKWRALESQRFPTPGQLAAICVKGQGGHAERFEKWRPLSDEEYDALSLSDKIRHHRILADRVWDEAGPIRRRVGSRNIADLRQDPDWRELERRGADHLAEASRLQSYLDRRAA